MNGDALTVRALSPFVPGGKDYAASRRLFVEPGFEEAWENVGCAGFRINALITASSPHPHPCAA